MVIKEHAKVPLLKKKITTPYQLLTIKHLKQTYQNKTLQTPPIPMQLLTSTLLLHHPRLS